MCVRLFRARVWCCFSTALAGAHADQRVLAVLLRRWYPDVMTVIEGMDVSVPVHCLLLALARLCVLRAPRASSSWRIVSMLHLSQLGISVVSLEWFMAIFSTTLPTHTALRVWDAFFLLGVESTGAIVVFLSSHVVQLRAVARCCICSLALLALLTLLLSAALFRVSLALFHCVAPKIVRCKGDIASLFHVLQSDLCDFHDSDELMKVRLPCAHPDHYAHEVSVVLLRCAAGQDTHRLHTALVVLTFYSPSQLAFPKSGTFGRSGVKVKWDKLTIASLQPLR